MSKRKKKNVKEDMLIDEFMMNEFSKMLSDSDLEVAFDDVVADDLDDLSEEELRTGFNLLLNKAHMPESSALVNSFSREQFLAGIQIERQLVGDLPLPNDKFSRKLPTILIKS